VPVIAELAGLTAATTRATADEVTDLSLRIVRPTRDVMPEQALHDRTTITGTNVRSETNSDLDDRNGQGGYHNSRSVARFNVAVEQGIQTG
jgi:hypothetical protein